jgi:hypothetical protein
MLKFALFFYLFATYEWAVLKTCIHNIRLKAYRRKELKGAKQRYREEEA